MKSIYLFRHAKSSWDNLNLSDINRALNERGVNDLPLMLRRLANLEATKIDLFLCSTAVRTTATCDYFQKHFSHEKSVRINDKNLYLANSQILLDKTITSSDEFNTLAFFGHNPGLTDFYNLLSGNYLDNLPTSGVIKLNFAIQSWSSLKVATGKTLFLEYPKKA